MRECLQFYIDGTWVKPASDSRLNVINPATETVAGEIALGNATDADHAVMAARRAFEQWSLSNRSARIDLLGAIAAEYQKRMGDLADAVAEEKSAPIALSRAAQVSPNQQ